MGKRRSFSSSDQGLGRFVYGPSTQVFLGTRALERDGETESWDFYCDLATGEIEVCVAGLRLATQAGRHDVEITAYEQPDGTTTFALKAFEQAFLELKRRYQQRYQ